MEGFQNLLRWFKKPTKSSKSKRKGKSTMKVSILYPSHDTTKQKLPPTKACLCRASMTLPPTPRDLLQDSTRLVWGRSCIDSPAHVYEEIPASCRGNCAAHYCDIKTCPQTGCDFIRRAQLSQMMAESGNNHTGAGKNACELEEYLAPTNEVTKSHSIFSDILKKVIRLPDGTLCKYDKISPLSALGLTLSNLKKCHHCQRPHGVYNGTVYRHGSNSSPDLVNLEWHCFQPTIKNPPTSGAPPLRTSQAPPTSSQNTLLHSQAPATSAIKAGLPSQVTATTAILVTSVSEAPPTCATQTMPPAQAPSLRKGRGRYRSTSDLRSPGLWETDQEVGKESDKKSGKSAFSAFQVLKPAEHQRLADLTSREVNTADSTKKNGEYAYYLSKVKHNFHLGCEVQRARTPPPTDHSKTGIILETGVPGAVVCPIKGFRNSHPISHDPSQMMLPPCGKHMNSGSKSMTSLHHVTNMELDQDFELQDNKSLNPHQKFNTLQNVRQERKYGAGSAEGLGVLSDAAMDRLSCRATNYKLTPRSRYPLGNKRSSYTEYRSAVDACQRARVYHNPLLSDIMKRNHDRQNLVV